jgi:hypothetical protein
VLSNGCEKQTRFSQSPSVLTFARIFTWLTTQGAPVVDDVLDSSRSNFSFYVIIQFFSLEDPMSSPTPFSALQARLDAAAAPAAALSSASPAADGGVGGIGSLNLTDQGALPGTPVVKSSKLFYPVLLSPSQDMCLSYIGMGATFCLRSSCTIRNHLDATRRYDFEGKLIVIKKNDSVAFSDPSAPFKRMDPSLLNQWIANPRSLTEWGEAFLAFKRCLEALPGETQDLVTTDMLSAKKRFQRQMQDARTPARTLFSDSEESKSEGFVDVPTLTTPSPFKPSTAALSIKTSSTDNKKNMARMLRRVETGLESASLNLIQDRTIIKDQDKILRGLEARLDTVQDQVGETPLGLSAEFVAPTLNGRVAILAEKVSSLKPSTVNLSETQVVTWVNSWWSRSGNQVQIKKANDFSTGCEQFLTSLVSSFQKQSNEVIILGAKINSLASAQPVPSQTVPPAVPSAFATLQQSLGMGAAPATNPGASGPTNSAQASTILNLELKVKALDAKLGLMMSGTISTTIRFGGAGFSGPRDVVPLVQAQLPLSYFGCFVNAAILMEWIKGNSGGDTLKDMERMHKLKIPSLAEVHSLKGLEAALPRLLGDVITFTGKPNVPYYTKVPTASVWTNGSTGLKEFILGSLPSVVAAVRATIDQRLQHGKELHTLARLALESSASFIMSMVSFTEENRESYALSNYPDEMQWSLNTRLGYRVWSEVYLPCAGLMEKVEPHDLQATSATIIYHVLATIDTQETFRQIGFKNHSVVSSEYVKFLSTNTGYDSIEKLLTRMTKLETEGKDLVVRTREAGASAKTASTTCGDMKKKVEAVEKKLTSHETRLTRGNL